MILRCGGWGVRRLRGFCPLLLGTRRAPVWRATGSARWRPRSRHCGHHTKCADPRLLRLASSQPIADSVRAARTPIRYFDFSTGTSWTMTRWIMERLFCPFLPSQVVCRRAEPNLDYSLVRRTGVSVIGRWHPADLPIVRYKMGNLLWCSRGCLRPRSARRRSPCLWAGRRIRSLVRPSAGLSGFSGRTT